MNSHALMNNYARFPVELIQGRGSWVRDNTGQEYLDFISGIAVNTLGHAHPRLTHTIARQAEAMLHCSNLFHIPQQEKLAEQLTKASGLGQAFFCNSGAEANEAAIKIARKFFFDQGSDRRTIITATNSFHGRLLSTLTATGQDKVKIGFDPLPPGFVHVPLNDLEALREAMTDQTAAILLEPLQGEGGVNLASHSYLQGVRQLCDEQGILLMLDEIQTGIGRTGAMFAFEHAGIKPDVLTLAKGLGGGVPIGAMLASSAVAASFGPGSHGSTFGGNPLSCAAALTVLNVIDQEELLDNVNKQGVRLKQGLMTLQKKHPQILEVRGHGLLVGAAFDQDVAGLVTACRDVGLLVLSAGPKVLRLLPPLNVLEQEIDDALNKLGAALQAWETA